MSKGADTTVPVRVKDWMDVSKLTLEKEVKDKIEDIVEIRKITIEIEVTIPKPDRAMQAEIGIKGALRQYKGLIDKQLNTALPLVYEQYKLDQAGKEDAFTVAQGHLEKANKYIKDCMDDVRVEIRKAAAKAMGDGTTAKDLMTFGRTSFKEMKLNRGAFNSEVEYKTDASNDTLRECLKYKDWQHCAIAWNFGEIRVRADKKHKLTKADIGKLKELLPEEAQNGAKHAAGMLKAFSETNMTFEFLEKSKRPKGKLDKFIIRGLKVQLEKNLSNVTVNVVNEFTAEKKSGKAEPEKGKEKEKEKGKEKGKSGK